MSPSLLSKMRYVRHPYLITRALVHPFDVRDSQKHSFRQNDYLQYSVPFVEGAKKLINQQEKEQKRLINAFYDSQVMVHINQVAGNIDSIVASMSFEMCQLLYLIVRVVRPEIVIETGVASGVSSSFILDALDKNGKGKLYSIDLHYRDGIFTPPGKPIGWIIPEHLRHRWNLLLGEGVKVLPKLLKKTGPIDIFLHDSSHLYKAMSKEYRIVWPFLKSNGLLLSDDVMLNNAFLDFADIVKQKPLIFSRIGAIKKLTSA